MQESVFVRGQEHKKSDLLDIARLISEALIGLEITGDMRSREQQSHKKNKRYSEASGHNMNTPGAPQHSTAHTTQHLPPKHSTTNTANTYHTDILVH